MTMMFPTDTDSAIPLSVIDADELVNWLGGKPQTIVNWVQGIGFRAAIGEICLIPDETGRPIQALAGYGSQSQRNRTRFPLAAAAAKLPAATYDLVEGLEGQALENEVLGWLLSHYAFKKYRDQSGTKAQLIAPKGIDATRLEIIAQGEYLTRDLINTPASDMGPQQLEEAFLRLAQTHQADTTIIRSNGLVDLNFPMIHAVGRASTRAPRLLEMRWGNTGPSLTLVGKGVCFDTGGLNLKPGGSMGLMKKDMGGAAAVMGLAHMIMALKLPIQLRVLIPAVENSVAGNSFRPQDILTSRKGLTVEINNTDAEGRLVLADALSYAAEETPDLLISMATLTGAARVAVGPDLAPYFTDEPKVATALEAAAVTVNDPVWRLPFHDPYESMIEPGIADLDNAPKGGFAGSITAALFLRRFAEGCPNYTHFDIYGWQPKAAAARPKGGTGQGTRAILEALPRILNL